MLPGGQGDEKAVFGWSAKKPAATGVQLVAPGPSTLVS